MIGNQYPECLWDQSINRDFVECDGNLTAGSRTNIMCTLGLRVVLDVDLNWLLICYDINNSRGLVPFEHQQTSPFQLLTDASISLQVTAQYEAITHSQQLQEFGACFR